MQQIKCDIAIIGAGTAGMTAYATAKRTGQRVVLIENGPYGTMCARVGCMPSKLLIAAADAAHAVASSSIFGVDVTEWKVDGKAVMQRVRAERDRFVQGVIDEVQAYDESDKVQGYARFLSNQRLQVDEHTQIDAEQIIVATGSSPVRPKPLLPLGDRLISNDDVFDWQDLPRSVLVVGTGAIGLELGQALSRLGVKVRFVSRSNSLAGIQHPELVELGHTIFNAELDIRFGVDVLSSALRDGQAWVTLRHQGQEFNESYDFVLAAAGRAPQLQGLQWEQTSAKLNERGAPVVDTRTLQVVGTPIYMAGDVSPTRALQHEAADDGRISARQAVKGEADPALNSRRSPIAIVFSDPQVAQVGTVYKQVPAEVVCGRVDFSRQGRARVMAKNQGRVHVYAHQDGRFLGAELIGPQVEHLAHLLAWSHQQGLSLEQMLAMPFYHPVLEEGLRTALRDAQRQLR